MRPERHGWAFTAKLSLHPRQVAAVNARFVPTLDEQTWAGRVLAAPGGGPACVVDGGMVDTPVVDRPRTVLVRAGYTPDLTTFDGGRSC